MPADRRLAVERGVGLSGFRSWLAHKRDVSVLRIRSARHGIRTEQEDPTMKVMNVVDPHKGSHTATMLDRERELRRIKVPAGGGQLAELLEWARR
jgi:hypothetical protein